MAHIFFHRSNDQNVVLDQSGSDVADMAEARACALRAIHCLLTTPGPEDWREWMLHVSDEEGEEIFSVAFSAVLGKPH